MLPCTSPKKALLACPLFPPWNLPSFTVESTLSSTCSCSNPPFSRQDAALAHLDSLPLIIWYSGQTALFLFPLAKVVPAFLPTVLSVALRPLFPFQQAQYAQVFLLKPAPFCTLFAGLGSTNKPATSLLLALVLFSPPCPPFHLSLISNSVADLAGTVFFSSCSIRLQWVPGHSFLPENDAADKLARRGALLTSSAIPCSLSRIHSCLFSDWRRTVSCKFFDTQVSSISTEKEGSVLSRFHCNGYSLLLVLSRIGRMENSSCSACGHLSSHSALSSYGLCTVYSLRPLVQAMRSCPASGAPCSSAMPPSLGRVGLINSNSTGACDMLQRELKSGRIRRQFTHARPLPESHIASTN